MLTIVCGGLLAFASQALRPKQEANIELERKMNILSTVLDLKEGDNIDQLYSEKIKEKVIDFQGNEIKGVAASSIDIAKEYKKNPEERRLPVYEFLDASGKIDYAVLPVYGFGLWNDIWGFVALQSDLNTIQGVKFAHKGETPGLGARIESEEIQSRFKGKSIFEAETLTSVVIQKGEGFDYSSELHKVDGMSGATLTGKGVNNMLVDYFTCYQNYLKRTD
jgi:Na+-transporting NADH:ubiquinone oxidoreductase subunit C